MTMMITFSGTITGSKILLRNLLTYLPTWVSGYRLHCQQ